MARKNVLIPEDLMAVDLPLPKVKQILFAREQKRKAEAILNPSQERRELAQRRIAWADAAEQDILAGKEPPPFPKSTRGRKAEA